MNLREEILNTHKIYMEEMGLAAIWLDRPITLGDGRRTARVTDGDLIQVANGRLTDCIAATHQIIGCYGNIYSSPLCIIALNLETNEPLIIQLQ